jgi:DNA polymerase-3 subunit delta'
LLVGHEAVLRLLERALAQGRLSHAYILAGRAHVGKGTLAMSMAQAVNCQGDAPPCGDCVPCRRIQAGRHADVVVLAVQEEAGHKSIGIDVVRKIQHQASLKPYEGACRVFIIDGAEFLTEEAANALLKTLEEPPPQVLIILTTVNADALLATVRSRCQELHLHPVAEATIAEALETRWGADADEARRLARLAQGCVGWAIRALEDPAVLETRARRLERLAALASASLEDRFSYAADLAALVPQQRTALRETLDLWASWWRDALVREAGTPELALDRDAPESEASGRMSRGELVATIRAIHRTAELLDMNVNPRLALEGLMLVLPGQPQSSGKGQR